MSLMGSALGRGLAGAGAAVEDIANKYIDQNLQLQKAQALADLQRSTAKNVREDDDTFRNDPNRVARDRKNKVEDITAEGGARSAVDLAGKKAAAMDPELLAADVARTTQVTSASATATADAQRKAELAKLTDPVYMKAERERERGLAGARHIESAGSTAQAELARFQLGQAKKLGELHDTLAEALTTGNKGLEEQTRDRIGALSGKDGKTTEFYKVAAEAAKVMVPAQKILADSMSSPEAKADAQQTIREQRLLMQSAAKRAGVDLTEARFAEPNAAALDALKKDPSKAADFDAKFGPGAAQKAGVTAQPAKPNKPAESGSLMERAPAYVPPADSVVGKARAKSAADAEQRTQAEVQKKQQAADAYAALPPGDRAAAFKMQSSPLFGFLSREQQVEISNRVNGR